MKLEFLLALALVFSLGCKPGPLMGAGTASSQQTDALTQLAAYQGPDRQESLEAGARAEGKLSWYTTLAGASRNLAAGFEQKYPFVKVELFRAGGEDLLQRILAEEEAGRFGFDILESSLPTLLVLREASLLTPYYSPEAGAYPDEAREPARDRLMYWAINRETYSGFAYNTRAVSDEDVPREYRDLLKPALRGKMAISNTDSDTRVIGAIVTNLGESLSRELSKQEIAIQMVSGQALSDLVASGEVPASPSIARNHALVAARKGAPVRWVPLEPVTASSGATALSIRAQHPNAALLFADFILGKDGQAILADLEYGSAAIDPGFRRWDPAKGLTAAEFEQVFQRWEQFLKIHLMRR